MEPKDKCGTKPHRDFKQDPDIHKEARKYSVSHTYFFSLCVM